MVDGSHCAVPGVFLVWVTLNWTRVIVFVYLLVTKSYFSSLTTQYVVIP